MAIYVIWNKYTHKYLAYLKKINYYVLKGQTETENFNTESKQYFFIKIKHIS